MSKPKFNTITQDKNIIQMYNELYNWEMNKKLTYSKFLGENGKFDLWYQTMNSIAPYCKQENLSAYYLRNLIGGLIAEKYIPTIFGQNSLFKECAKIDWANYNKDTFEIIYHHTHNIRRMLYTLGSFGVIRDYDRLVYPQYN